MKKTLIILVALALFVSAFSPRPSMVIHGQVVTAWQMAGDVVQVRAPDGAGLQSTVSGPDGVYRLRFWPRIGTPDGAIFYVYVNGVLCAKFPYKNFSTLRLDLECRPTYVAIP
jgi:hypothetical protein